MANARGIVRWVLRWWQSVEAEGVYISPGPVLRAAVVGTPNARAAEVDTPNARSAEVGTPQIRAGVEI